MVPKNNEGNLIRLAVVASNISGTIYHSMVQASQCRLSAKKEKTGSD
jgi:hypothetical protein